MTDTTPLPCPFCGGEAAITSTLYGYPASHWVKCGNCGACSTNYSNRRSALTAWNTRANAGARLVEALREARRIIADIDDYMKRPNRGDWGEECACCMGELLDDDRQAIAKIDAALSEVSRG